jgi:hypothetical protein
VFFEAYVAGTNAQKKCDDYKDTRKRKHVLCISMFLQPSVFALISGDIAIVVIIERSNRTKFFAAGDL